MKANRFDIEYDYESNVNHFSKHNNCPADVLNTLLTTHTQQNNMLNKSNGAENNRVLETVQYDQFASINTVRLATTINS
jgi:hypothetical protein